MHGSGRLRWVDYARRSMQRIGFLKWVLKLASPSQPQTLESLTVSFSRSVTRAVTPDAEQLLAPARGRPKLEGETLSLQDVLLSDPALPSHSGVITGKIDEAGYRHAVYVEIPAWAERLRLLRDKNYTVTDRGRVLLMFSSFDPNAPPQFGAANPLFLNTPERCAALFCILDADGDFLREMYRRLLDSAAFTRADAGDAALEALQVMRSTRLKSASTGLALMQRTKLDRVIEAIKNQNPTSLGPKESVVTPRTEPLVDCGLLEKLSASSYRITPYGNSFFGALVAAHTVDEFLLNNFIRALCSMTGQAVTANRPALTDIVSVYSRLRSRAGLGYVSLRELTVAVAAAQFERADAELWEISSVEQSLRAPDASRFVRMAAGRTPGHAQIRIDLRALASNV